MNPLADASAHKVATTLERTIVPDPIPADAEKVLPYELAKYEANGYGAWSYGPGLAAERRLDLMPAGYDGTARRRLAAPALLRHHRHPHRRRAVAGAGDLLRLQGRPLVGLLGGDALHAPRARRRRADGERPAPATSRSTSASRWATRATTPSTTSCAGTSTSSTAGASTPTPGRRTRRPADRGPPSSTRTTRPASTRHPLVPGARQPRPLLDGVPPVDDYLRKTYVGEEILDLGNVFEDPRGPAAAASTWAASTGGRPTATSSASGRSRTSRRRPRSSPPTPTAAR